MNKSIINQNSLTCHQLFSTDGLHELIEKGKGPLSTIPWEVQALYKSPMCATDSLNLPDLSINFFPLGMNCERTIFKKYINLNSKTYNEFFKPYLQEEHIITIGSELLRPESKGHLHIRDANPFKPLTIHANFLSHPNDVKRFIFSIRESQKIINSEPFKCADAKIAKTYLENCKKFVFDTDEYWACAIKHLAVIGDDPVGTCKMGPDGDVHAVVDHKLRVRGINCLRVVDGSIFPEPLTATGSLPIIMAAEKLAYMIKNTWIPKP